MLKSICAALLLSVCFLQPAYAIPVTVNFTAGPFYPGGNKWDAPYPAPQTSVSGSFTYEADNLFAPIKVITAVDLTIAEHKYTVDELGFQNFQDGSNLDYVIGGASLGVLTMDRTRNDFWFEWGTYGVAPMAYVVPSFPDTCIATDFSEFSITADYYPTPAPEPSTVALLLGGVGFLLWRKPRRA